MSPPPTAREGSSGQTYLPLFYCTETNIYCKFELVANTQQMLFYKYEYMSKEDDDASPRQGDSWKQEDRECHLHVERSRIFSNESACGSMIEFT